MRTNWGGSLATLVLTAPLAAIPLMAILGVPQLTNCSGSVDSNEPDPALSRPAISEASATAKSDWPVEAERAFAESTPRNTSAPSRSGERLPRPVVFSTGNDSSAVVGQNPRRDSPAAGMETGPGESLSSDRSTFEAGQERDLLWRTAAQQLQDLGIEDYRLEPGQQADSCVFVCQFAAGPDARIIRRFEAEASRPIDAVQNVLAQINDWRRQTGDRQSVPR